MFCLGSPKSSLLFVSKEIYDYKLRTSPTSFYLSSLSFCFLFPWENWSQQRELTQHTTSPASSYIYVGRGVAKSPKQDLTRPGTLKPAFSLLQHITQQFSPLSYNFHSSLYPGRLSSVPNPAIISPILKRKLSLHPISPLVTKIFLSLPLHWNPSKYNGYSVPNLSFKTLLIFKFPLHPLLSLIISLYKFQFNFKMRG